jgi:hypothetical protein
MVKKFPANFNWSPRRDCYKSVLLDPALITLNRDINFCPCPVKYVFNISAHVRVFPTADSFPCSFRIKRFRMCVYICVCVYIYIYRLPLNKEY